VMLNFMVPLPAFVGSTNRSLNDLHNQDLIPFCGIYYDLIRITRKDNGNATVHDVAIGQEMSWFYGIQRCTALPSHWTLTRAN
jgi:hypothetical protein